MIVAPKTECTLPILCISTIHGAMSGTRTPNSRKVTGICAGLPRDLNSRLAANTLARLKAVFCLPAPTEIAAKHQAKEHRSKAFNAENKRRPDRAVRWRPKAGTNLIDLLSGWTFTTQSIGRHGAQFTWSREGFFERESLGGRSMLSQGVQLLRRFFD